MKGSPESPRNQLRACIREHGEAAAFELGAKLGLKAGALKRLIPYLMGQPSARSSNRPTSTIIRSSNRPSTIIRSSSFKATHYLWDNKEQVATMLKIGPCQSEVRFPNGNVRVVANNWLTPIS